jgi:hypothetical protein
MYFLAHSKVKITLFPVTVFFYLPHCIHQHFGLSSYFFTGSSICFYSFITLFNVDLFFPQFSSKITGCIFNICDFLIVAFHKLL